MYGFKAGAAPKDKPKGGKIKGPGAGTSDSIKTEVPSGSYIMPADSTAKIGEKALGQLGKPVPVNVSNGEYQMPPEQVHAVGAQVLDQMKDATHTPVAAMGLKPQKGELYFADGGAVESTDDLIARISAKYGTGSGYSPRPQPAVAAAPQQPVQRPAAPSIGSAADALRNRKRQIDAAAGFADGGLVDDERRLAPAGSFSSMQRDPGIPRSGAPRQMPQGEPLGVKDLPQGTNRPNPIMQRPAEPGSFDSVQRAPIVTTSGTPRQMPQGDPLRPSDLAQGFVAGGNAATQQITGGASAAERDFMAGGQAATEQIAGFGRKIASALAPQQEGSYSPEALGQPAPNPNAGAAWGAVKDALLYSSDAAAIRARNQQPTTTTTQAGAAQSAPAAPQPAIPAAAPSTQGFNPSAMTDQQRNDAGDAYRSAWQREAPSGMRGANDQALGFYNAEQQVRGSNVTARRGANGVMEFSGNGEGALPQNYTRGFDLNAANERMARANATRTGEPERGGYDPEAQVTIVRDEEGERKRAQWERDIDRFSMVGKGGGRAGRAQQALDLREQETAMANQRAAEELAMREREGAANRGLAAQAEANRTAIDRERLGVDQQRAGTEANVRGFEARGLERVEKLYTAYENAKTPEERAAVAEQVRAMSGKEAPNRFTVVPGGQEVTEQGLLRTVPSMVLNNQTGQPVDLGRTSARPSPPENHIAALKKSPNQAAQFDAIYGPGAAANYLGAN